MPLGGNWKKLMMSTSNNKLDEFFSKKDSKKKKIGSSNKTNKADGKLNRETIPKKQVEESDEVNLDVTPSSSSLAGLEKLSFLSISSSSIGSWAEEEEKQEGQPILQTKGRSLSNMKKDMVSQEEQSKDAVREEKFTGWKTAEIKPSDTSETKESGLSPATKPEEEKFPTLEETVRLPKTDKTKETTNLSNIVSSTENRNITSYRPGSRVAGNLRALLLESQQDKPLTQGTTVPTDKKQELETTSDTSGNISSAGNGNNMHGVQERTSQPVKETSQRRRKFSGLQAIIEEASKDKQNLSNSNGFTDSRMSREKPSHSSIGTSNRGTVYDHQQKKSIESKSKQKAPNVQPTSSEERNNGSSLDSRRSTNRYSVLSDMLQEDAE